MADPRDRVVFPEPHLRPDSPTFWFAGQLGLIAGFVAAWPTASWQLGRGLRIEPRRLPYDERARRPPKNNEGKEISLPATFNV